jgi:hypothetical protein
MLTGVDPLVDVSECLVNHTLECAKNTFLLSIRYVMLILGVVRVVERYAVEGTGELHVYDIATAAHLDRDAWCYETINEIYGAAWVKVANSSKVVTQFEFGDYQDSVRSSLGKRLREAISNHLYGAWGKLLVAVIP